MIVAGTSPPISIDLGKDQSGMTLQHEYREGGYLVWNLNAGQGSEVSLKSFRKDVILKLYNEAGQLAIAYKVFRCWVSEYSALPELDANAQSVAIESITLVHEGWERDEAVKEPVEPD
jgi:hypothetical protein